MKIKLLKKIRKRFDWKFIDYEGIKTMFIYDKKFNGIRNNSGLGYIFSTDLEYLLDQYDDGYLKNQYRIKKMKLKFDKL